MLVEIPNDEIDSCEGRTLELCNVRPSAYEQRSLRWFRVGEVFPRITESMLPEGIGDAAYTLSLAACKEFAVDEGKAFAPFPEASNDA
jgi:hypothetical protein